VPLRAETLAGVATEWGARHDAYQAR